MFLALRISFACVVFLLIGMPSTLLAATVTASWNPNPESNIAGYKISYGTQSGVYTTVVDVGNTTSWPVTLAGPQRYYFAVQAYNTSNLLSPYSAEVFFDAPAAPTLTSLSPTSGPVGMPVTIARTNFGATQGASTVKFNGVSATPTNWSATSIVVPVPVGALTGSVVVTVSGAASNALPFTVGVLPILTSLTPAIGPVGTSVTIGGTNFGATKGTSTVKFNGKSATPTGWSATSIVVPVPAGATTGNVVVAVGGLASNGLTLHRRGGADADVADAGERPGRDVGDDCGNQFRGDEGDELRYVQRDECHADELVGDEHRGAGSGRGDDGERSGDGRRSGQQRTAVHGLSASEADECQRL